MKHRRVVSNKEYMQDRQGVVLIVIYLLSVVVPVLMFLIAWGIKNGRNLLCNSELSSNFALT